MSFHAEPVSAWDQETEVLSSTDCYEQRGYTFKENE